MNQKLVITIGNLMLADLGHSLATGYDEMYRSRIVFATHKIELLLLAIAEVVRIIPEFPLWPIRSRSLHYTSQACNSPLHS